MRVFITDALEDYPVIDVGYLKHTINKWIEGYTFHLITHKGDSSA